MSRVIQKKLLASLPLAVLLTASFGIQAARSQSLSDSLAAAYQTNPTLLAERANLRSIDEHLPQALSAWRPTVQITSSIGRTLYSETSTPDFRSTPINNALTITQPLFVGAAGSAIARSKEEIQAERARLFDSEQTVLLNVATAYFNLLRDQATLDLQVKNEQVLSTQLDATRDRFQVGEVTRTDVSQAEAALAGAVASRINAEGNLAVSRASFLQVVGIPAGVVRPVDAPEALLPKTVDEATQTAATDNPQVVAAQFDENAARNHVGELIGGLLPSAQLVGTYSSARQSAAAAGFLGGSGNITIDTTSLVAQVTVPLYESGNIYSQVRAAKQLASKARTTIDINRRQAIQSAQAAYQSLVSARAQITSLRAQIEASTVALEGVRQEANVGSRTVLDILNAEQLLVNSQVTLVQSQRDSLVAAYTLLDAVGRLTAKSLGLNVPLYDYEAYFREYKNAWWGTEIDDSDR